MSCGSDENEAGGSIPRRERPQGMESESSSGASDESSSTDGSTTSGCSPTTPDTPLTPPPESRRAHMRCTTQRHRRSLAHVACQTDYTEDFQPIQGEIPQEVASTSEATLRLLIQNFKSMSDTVRGPSKEIQGVSWRIMVMPRQHVVQKKGTQKCLGFFLQCCPNAYSETWSCQAQAELRLISQKTGVPHFTRKTNHNYTSKENDWGYSCFMTWADILDENQGYIKDDRVVLEVTVKAEPPKNILSHADFKKRIEKWKELAQMHFDRKCIDLAIEANFQALKFCKDRDKDIKTMLEEQRTFFIDQKVQESILRIEKHNDGPQNPEDEGTSQADLKKALAQTTKNGHKKGKTVKKPKMRARDPSPSPPSSPPTSEVHVEEKPKTETAATIKNSSYTREVDGKLVFEGSFARHIEELLPCEGFKSFDFPADIDITALKQSLAWTRRNKEDEDLYSELALSVQEDFEKLHLNMENPDKFESYEEQLAAYDHDHQRILFEQLIERNFIDAFTRQERKSERKRQAIEDAKAFVEDTLDRLAATPDETAAIDEAVSKLGASLAFMDDPKSKAWRNGLLDRMNEDIWHENSLFVLISRTHYLPSFEPCRGKLTILDALPPPHHWLHDDISDAGSTLSSDSERQTDGCIKAKRTKRERGICNCLTEKGHGRPPKNALVEMAVQTDAVLKKVDDILRDAAKPTNNATPQGRILKKPQKKNKPKIEPSIVAAQGKAEGQTLTTARSAATTQTQMIPSAPLPPAAQPVDDDPYASYGNFRVLAVPKNDLLDNQGMISSRTLPMEYAMQFFPNFQSNYEDVVIQSGNPTDQTRIMEEWVRTWLQEAQRVRPPINGTGQISNPQDFIAAFSDQNQIVSALSAVALNLMNVRRLTNRASELMTTFQDRSGVVRTNKLNSQIFNMAGMTFEISMEPSNSSEPAMRPLPDSSHSDGDYILVEQIAYMDDLKTKIEEQMKNEKEMAKRLTEALKKIDEKLRANEKTIDEHKKKADEQDKNAKKLDKANKQEIQQLKTQLNNEKDRNTNLSKELKEKNKEVKRLETRCTTVTAERDDFTEKFKTAQKDMTTFQKKNSDEVAKLRREMSSLNESRKNLQNGIAERDNEIKSNQHQIEERNSQIKRLKNEMEQERQKAALANRELEKALERARKAEVDLLTRELETGIALLERAQSDASKHCAEMEDAANNRARSSAEISSYIANKNEWSAIVEQIEVYIRKSKADFAVHIETIQSGKPLASLPKINVPKPPNPAPILKVPVVVPVEPTKNAPGPIGPPRQSSTNISPQSRAPGSPIPKQPQHSPGSPVRHPGAIGTRPNGASVNGTDRFEPTGTGSSILQSWGWPEPLDSVLNHLSGNSDLLLTSSTPRVDQNGWDEQNNTWSNNLANNVNQYISSPLNSTRATTSSSSMYGHPPGWPRPQSAQHQPTIEQQRIMLFNAIWQPIIERVSKKLHVDMDQAFQLVRQYVHENGINLMNARVQGEEIVEGVCQKRYAETAARLPPGAAPGYLQNPLLGTLLDRSPIPPPLGFTQENLLNNLLGDTMRPSSSTDKWSF